MKDKEKNVGEQFKMERIPGINASEGDPPFVDPNSSKVEHDYTPGEFGKAEAMAIAEDFERTMAARYRAGAAAVNDYQKTLDNLPSKGNHVLSKDSRQRRKEKRRASVDLYMKGIDMEEGATSIEEELIAEDLKEAGYKTDEERKDMMDRMRSAAKITDMSAQYSGRDAAEDFDEEQKRAARRIVEEQDRQP